MRILIVGAGAVGQVFALHLSRGGATVSVLVKEGQRDRAKHGFPIYRYKKRAREDCHFKAAAVLSDLSEVARQKWDQAWLCVPTTSLEGPWFEGLVEATPGAVIVSLVPGISVRSRLLAALPEDEICEGSIGFFAYGAPLGQETLPEPGTAFCLPPMTRCLFQGSAARSIVEVLRAGGLPAAVSSQVRQDVAFTSAVILPLMVSYEGAGWSFGAWLRSDWLKLGAGAAREAVRVSAGALGARAPFYRMLLYAPLLKWAFRWAQWALPIDFERYLAVHFQKVRPQTRLLIPSYRFLGQQVDVPTPSIAALEQRAWKPNLARVSLPPLETSTSPQEK